MSDQAKRSVKVTPWGVVLGTGLGASVGVVTESLAVSTGVGAGVGLLLGLMASQRTQSAAERESDGKEAES